MYRKVIPRLPLDITISYGLWTVKLNRLNIDVFLALCHLKKIAFQAMYQHIIFTWLRIVNDQYLDKRREIPLEFRELPKIMEMRGMWHLNNGITKSSGKWGLEPNFTCLYCLFSRVWLFVTPWTVAHQAPLPMRFSRQEEWSGLPRPPPSSCPGMEPESHIYLHWQEGSLQAPLGGPVNIVLRYLISKWKCS